MLNKVQNFLVLTSDLDEAVEKYGNESEEAGVIRDKMDEPWYDMSEKEQKEVEKVLGD
jgi:hypothetical protein